MRMIENRVYDELHVGDTAQIVRQLTRDDIAVFAIMSGDVNPAHVDEEFAEHDRFHKIIAHGMWGGALISAVLGTELPGPGTIYLEQSLKFLAPVGIGDTITARVEVVEKTDKGHVRLACSCVNQDGVVVISGLAEVIAPRQKICRERKVMPELSLEPDHRHYDAQG